MRKKKYTVRNVQSCNLFMLGGMKCEKILVSEESDDPSSVHGAGRRRRLHRKISDNLAEKRSEYGGNQRGISDSRGMPIGIYMETNGVMVLGTDAIEGTDGDKYKPADHIVRQGDYITGINDEVITNKKELIAAVKKLDDENVVLHLRRKDQPVDVRLKAVESSEEEYRLGIWVRDNAQGLGTVTFLNGNSQFGALGHGIHDVDTNELLEIAKGSLYETSISAIQKGEDGSPGGMEGVIVYNRYNILGEITENTDAGIFGTVDRIHELFADETPLKAGRKTEIQRGPAKIRCCVDGVVREYDVNILKVDLSEREVNKGIVLEVTDKELLEKTGGIIQGMSGSPIIQNDKIIGAVTHVFVQDAKKGYGIFIENMLEHVKS